MKMEFEVSEDIHLSEDQIKQLRDKLAAQVVHTLRAEQAEATVSRDSQKFKAKVEVIETKQ